MSTALTTRQPTALLPTPGEWQTLSSMAQVAIASGLLPPTIKTEQAAIFVAMKGRELAIPTTYAWSNISVINGKPVCSAELMLALIYRDHGPDAVAFVETTDTACHVTYRRAGVAERRPFEFTMAQAKQAGLAGSATWSKYPAAMLRARCVSALARMAFPDSIAGMYTAEELGASVTVTADGEVVLDEAPVMVSDVSASAGAPIAPLPAANLAPVPVLAGATADQRAGYLRSMHALGMDADAAMAIVRDTSGVTFEEATRGQMGTVYRAAQTGRLAQVDGRWHIVEPPAESVAEAAPLVAQLAAAVK